MARRWLLVAIIAAGAALVPASAQAVAPTGFTATSSAGTVPVSLGWTTSVGDLTQQVFRIAGACPATIAGGDPVAAAETAPLAGGASAATDSPGDGTWCYYVQVTDLGGPANSNGIAVTVDRPSTGTVAVSNQVNGNFIRGSVNVTGTAADVGSGVASSALLASTGDCRTTGVAVGANWTPVGDGTYNVCNVVTDGAGNVTVVQTIQVVVDNTLPTGSVVTPAAGTSVSGAAVALTTNAADANILAVRWQRSVNGTTGWSNFTPSTPANSLSFNWNTVAGPNRTPDGPIFLRVLVADKAGNVFPSAAVQLTVDNTAPDVRAVVTAPPVVAGSPVLSWKPAHDAVGVTSYDVLRGGVVIGTVPSVVGAAAFSYADKTAPDQVTSSYVVRAYDAAGHFTDSAAVSVLVDSTAVSAAKNLTAATPTSAAPVLTWQAPATFAVNHYDVYRDGLLIGSTTGVGPTYTDATATEGVHDYAVLARDAAAHPGVLSSSFKVVFDKTAPTSGGTPTAQVLPTGQVNLAWPAAGDALSGVAGYIVRRAGGATPPATLDGGSAVCAPTAPSCADAAAGTGVWSYGVFARDAAGNVALIGTVSNVAVKDNIAPLAPTKLKVTRPKAKTKRGSVTYRLRWVNPTAADLDRIVVVLNLKHPPVGPADGKTVYHGLGTAAKVKLLPGQNGYLAIYAFDHSGNYSLKPIRKRVTLAGLIPLRPLSGSTLRTTSPRLTWKATHGSSYYNVQLFRNGKHVLVAWPSKASYRIPAGKLKPGTYVWFVWPAVQHSGGSPTFGKLIGRATFTYKK
jgi:Bacterial Ig-like domain